MRKIVAGAISHPTTAGVRFLNVIPHGGGQVGTKVGGILAGGFFYDGMIPSGGFPQPRILGGNHPKQTRRIPGCV
jgi:hypothetical protein